MILINDTMLIYPKVIEADFRVSHNKTVNYHSRDVKVPLMMQNY